MTCWEWRVGRFWRRRGCRMSDITRAMGWLHQQATLGRPEARVLWNLLRGSALTEEPSTTWFLGGSAKEVERYLQRGLVTGEKVAGDAQDIALAGSHDLVVVIPGWEGRYSVGLEVRYRVALDLSSARVLDVDDWRRRCHG